MAVVNAELVVYPNAQTFMPALALEQADERREQFRKFVAKHLKEGIHYGQAGGSGRLPALLKPGAELLCSFFGCHVVPELLESISDWTGAEHGGQPLFAYTYRCRLMRGDVPIAEASGHCNSWESRYRW